MANNEEKGTTKWFNKNINSRKNFECKKDPFQIRIEMIVSNKRLGKIPCEIIVRRQENYRTERVQPLRGC